MKVLLYQDATLNLNLIGVSEGLNKVTHGDLYFATGRTEFKLKPGSIKYPVTHQQLSQTLAGEIEDAALALIITRTAYENNYFYEAKGKVTILSFYAWEQLTSLPLENGVVYFLSSILRFCLPLPEAHDLTTGCINDFLWDKTAVDLGMRSGNLCSSCQHYLQKKKLDPRALSVFRAIKVMLDLLGSASRANENVLNYLTLGSALNNQTSEEHFHVFLCHNAKDKPEVRKIARSLEARNILPWLDEDQLRPGLAWQVALEEQISQIDSAVVFVGSSGMGPWQEMEVRSFLSEFVQRKCPVIPTILSEAKKVPELPIFLRQMMWVDFRENPERALDLLIWGITGKRPTHRNA